MRAPARTFQDLVVWQRAHEFVLAAYRYSEEFPRREIYGLTAQFRRAAVSVPANIAEGFRKRSDLDKVRFLNIARGSLEECRYYLILAADLQYSKSSSPMPLLEQVSRLLESFSNSILNTES